MKTYQIEVWNRGGLLFRTEETDDVDRARRIAQHLYDALGVMHTVFILVDNRQYLNYEWPSLT